jgi:hypothetical protein
MVEASARTSWERALAAQDSTLNQLNQHEWFWETDDLSKEGQRLYRSYGPLISARVEAALLQPGAVYVDVGGGRRINLTKMRQEVAADPVRRWRQVKREPRRPASGSSSEGLQLSRELSAVSSLGSLSLEDSYGAADMRSLSDGSLGSFGSPLNSASLLNAKNLSLESQPDQRPPLPHHTEEMMRELGRGTELIKNWSGNSPQDSTSDSMSVCPLPVDHLTMGGAGSNAQATMAVEAAARLGSGTLGCSSSFGHAAAPPPPQMMECDEVPVPASPELLEPGAASPQQQQQQGGPAPPPIGAAAAAAVATSPPPPIVGGLASPPLPPPLTTSAPAAALLTTVADKNPKGPWKLKPRGCGGWFCGILVAIATRRPELIQFEDTTVPTEVTEKVDGKTRKRMISAGARMFTIDYVNHSGRRGAGSNDNLRGEQ